MEFENLSSAYKVAYNNDNVLRLLNPSRQVENNMDNDGGVHPGSLQYYRAEFPKNGFQILSEYNFTYTACNYCPGEYWPDNKTGNHTLIIFATEQPLPEALAKLRNLVWDNVYV